MKKIIYSPLYLSIAGFILLLISVMFGWIEGFSILPAVLTLTGLFTAGISLVLLDKVKGWIKTAGIIFSISGFLIWSLAVYQLIELKFFWNIGLGLLFLGMIAAMYSIFNFRSALSRIFAGIITVGLLIIAAGIFMKWNQSLFFGLGTALLIIFSIVALYASLIKKTA